MFGLKLLQNNLSNFHPLEVVCRGSETQLQVGENLNNLIYRFKGYIRTRSIRINLHASKLKLGNSSFLMLYLAVYFMCLGMRRCIQRYMTINQGR